MKEITSLLPNLKSKPEALKELLSSIANKQKTEQNSNSIFNTTENKPENGNFTKAIDEDNDGIIDYIDEISRYEDEDGNIITSTFRKELDETGKITKNSLTETTHNKDGKLLEGYHHEDLDNDGYIDNSKEEYYEYDENGNYTNMHIMTREFDKNGNCTLYKLESDDDHDGILDNTAQTISEYDKNGNLISETKERKTTYGWNNYKCESKYTYDDIGNLTKETSSYDWDGDGKIEHNYESNYFYNENGKLLKKVLFEDDNGDGIWDEVIVYDESDSE